MTIEISEKHAPLHPKHSGPGRKKSPMRLAIESLDVGEAITISGASRSSISVTVLNAGRSFDVKRKYSTFDMGDGKTQVVRIL